MLSVKQLSLLNMMILALGLALAPAARAGGVDGAGGGNTLPAESAQPEQIRNIARHAKKDLRLLVMYLQRSQGTGLTQIDQKLFGGPKTLLDVLETIDIEFTMDPCLDSDRNPMDASVYASKPDTICFSIGSIAPKVVEERARIEVLALLLHELSHFLGTTEEEAKQFQKTAIALLKRTEGITSTHLLEHLGDRLARIRDELREALNNNFNPFNREKVWSHVYQAVTKLSKIEELGISPPYAVYGRPEHDYLAVQAARIELISTYCYHDRYYPEAYEHERYDKLFSGKDSITFGEFRNRPGNSDRANLYANELLYRIHNESELKAQVRQLAEYFDGQWYYVDRLVTESAFMRPRGPWTGTKVNPWESFKGQYQVLSSRCVGSEEIPARGLPTYIVGECEADRSGALYLHESLGDQTIAYGLYEGGTMFFLGRHPLAGMPFYRDKSKIQVSGDANTAEWTNEFGERWNAWELSSFKMSRTTEGYQLTRLELKRDPNRPQDIVRECRFSLKKINSH